MIIIKIILLLMLLSLIVQCLPSGSTGRSWKERTDGLSPKTKKKIFESEFHKWR